MGINNNKMLIIEHYFHKMIFSFYNLKAKSRNEISKGTSHDHVYLRGSEIAISLFAEFGLRFHGRQKKLPQSKKLLNSSVNRVALVLDISGDYHLNFLPKLFE